MGLRFVTGLKSFDHQAEMVRLLNDDKKKAPDDAFFYLVPNHIKFATEVSVLEKLSLFEKSELDHLEIIASSQVQVFSFTRLAWYFLQKSSVYQQKQLSKTGLTMLLRKILLDHYQELSLYKSDHYQNGFIEQLVALFAEFKTGNISSEDLAEMTARAESDANLFQKLTDLSLLYSYYEAALKDQFIGSEDLLDFLGSEMTRQGQPNSHFYIEGFSYFTAKEMNLIQILLQQAKSVTISLIMPSERIETAESLDFQDLFYAPKQLYQTLYQFARQQNIPIVFDQAAATLRPQMSSDLLLLEAVFEDDQRLAPQGDFPQSKGDIAILSCQNEYTELRQVGLKIQELVQNEHYRYRDFIILANDLNPYEVMIEPLFKELKIPYFNDNQVNMQNHPLVEAIKALFEIQRNFWRYEDVMRLLRSELFLPTEDDQTVPLKDYRRAVDLTENYLLENGMSGKGWLTTKDWQITKQRYVEGQMRSELDQQLSAPINRIHHFLRKIITTFFKKLEQAKNSREAAGIFFEFLEENGVSQRLAYWRDQAIEAGNLAQAKEHEQTWGMLVQLLEEYVTIMAEQPFESAQFTQLIESGFTQAEYSKIPSTLDEVTFSELGMTQPNQYKVAFIIGATDHNLPADASNISLLREDERVNLSQQTLANEKQQYLRENFQESNARAPYQAYLAFLTASEKLFFTLPLSDDKGKARLISPYLKRLDERLAFKKAYFEQTIHPQTELMPYLANRQQISSYLVRQLREAFEIKSDLTSSTIAIYNELNTHLADKKRVAFSLSSLTFKNRPAHLKEEIVEQLYGKQISSSVSRLESFNRCEYQHFLNYGLGLEERKLLELTPMEAGNYYHEILDLFIKEMQNQQLNLKNINDAQLNLILDAIEKQVDLAPQYLILTKTARMQFAKEQLQATIQKIVTVLKQQSSFTQAQPYQTEQLFGEFGPVSSLPPVTLELNQAGHLQLRGKIDRIDRIQTNQQDFLNVVDYKSSEHDLDFNAVYYGTSLQMLTYLQAISTNLNNFIETGSSKPRPKIGGAYYLHLQNPLLATRDIAQNVTEEEGIKAFKYKGIILNDADLLAGLDSGREPGAYSKLFPIQFKNDETYSATSKSRILKPNDFDQLLKYNEKQLIQTGEAILAGENKLNPYKMGNKIACSTCPFKSVCQFDVMLPENKYNRLKIKKKEEALAAILEGEDNHGNN